MDKRRQPTPEFKHPETYEQFIKFISKCIHQTGFDEESWGVLFTFHNQYVLPEAPEWSRSCSSCRNRVRMRTKEWWENNIEKNNI